MTCSKMAKMADTDDGSIEWVCEDGHSNPRRDQKLRLTFKIAYFNPLTSDTTEDNVKTVQVSAFSKVAERIAGINTQSLLKSSKSDPKKLKNDLSKRFNTEVFRFQLQSTATGKSVSITVKDILDYSIERSK